MATLIRPPPNDPAKSMMENNLELTQLSDIEPDLFTNTRPLWHPPTARGVYGGAVIAQCLSAAQRTVPPSFSVHSMHCYFVLAGRSDVPIIYHVEHVREGRSFATRTVQARQRGAPIFTVTLSFMKEAPAGEKLVEHALCIPDVPGPEEAVLDATTTSHGPFESKHVGILNNDLDGKPHLKKTRLWIRTRGKIAGGHEAHLNALAYMSDSFFIGTVARVHKLWRNPPPTPGDPYEQRNGGGEGKVGREDSQTDRQKFAMTLDMVKRIHEMNGATENTEERDEIGMMVSLDHTIYFHLPRDFRADDWLFSEMDTPWAGNNRGVVQQRIWTRDGRLVATCYQEGLVRLKQGPSKNKL